MVVVVVFQMTFMYMVIMVVYGYRETLQVTWLSVELSFVRYVGALSS